MTNVNKFSTIGGYLVLTQDNSIPYINDYKQREVACT